MLVIFAYIFLIDITFCRECKHQFSPVDGRTDAYECHEQEIALGVDCDCNADLPWDWCQSESSYQCDFISYENHHLKAQCNCPSLLKFKYKCNVGITVQCGS